MMIQVIEEAIKAIEAEQHAVLCVVIETFGSAPRPKGALMLVLEGETPAIFGSVSGGCIENAVIAEALDMSERGLKHHHYGIDREEAFALGLACGGKIEVGLWKLGHVDLPALREAIAAHAARQMRHLVFPDARAPLCLRCEAGEGASAPIEPPVHLMICGAVHIAQSLSHTALQMGWQVSLIDPRAVFATQERFPGVHLIEAWPDEAFEVLEPDCRTACVALTHDAKLDEPFLGKALPSEAFYVGALGSVSTQHMRRSALVSQGLARPIIDRLHGPVGSNIGAVNPEEIAVSIISEIVAVLRLGQSAFPLTQR